MRLLNQSMFQGDAPFESLPDCARTYSSAPGMFLNSGNPTVEKHLFSWTLREWSAILHLLTTTGPLAILLRVWSIILFTVQTHSYWTFSHVLKEVFERCQPAFAHLYSSPTVVLVVVISGIVATLPHVLPDCVFLGSALAVYNARIALSSSHLFLKAATASHRVKGICSDPFLTTTVTLAKAHGPLPFQFGFKDHKPSESLTC